MVRPHGLRRSAAFGRASTNACALSQEVARQVKGEIVALAPQFRAFARALAGNVELADQLVEETILKAMGRIKRLPAEADVRTWLFSILHQTFRRHAQKYDQCRMVDGQMARIKRTRDVGSVRCANFAFMFERLCAEDRAVLMLIGGAQCSSAAAAKICGRSVATTRRQMNEAHARLAQLLVAGTKTRAAAPSTPHAPVRSTSTAAP